MSTSQKAINTDFDRARIEQILKAAHRERNQAIGQLFSSAYGVLKDTIIGLGHKQEGPHGTLGGAKG